MRIGGGGRDLGRVCLRARCSIFLYLLAQKETLQSLAWVCKFTVAFGASNSIAARKRFDWVPGFTYDVLAVHAILASRWLIGVRLHTVAFLAFNAIWAGSCVECSHVRFTGWAAQEIHAKSVQ